MYRIFRRATLLLALVASMAGSAGVAARDAEGIRYARIPDTAYAVVAEITRW